MQQTNVWLDGKATLMPTIQVCKKCGVPIYSCQIGKFDDPDTTFWYFHGNSPANPSLVFNFKEMRDLTTGKSGGLDRALINFANLTHRWEHFSLNVANNAIGKLRDKFADKALR